LTAEPYLSVVVAARNDDHGGNLLARMQIFVSGWIEQARRYGIASELIIVEWNPPPDRPRLFDALRWPQDLGPCEVRIIEVPPELHARYPHSDALPLYQMIAKNAGIRRARGQFVLATNIDILFSDELAKYLAARQLERGRMYRIDRHDVMSEVPVEDQRTWCRTHLIRINRREGSFPVKPDGSPALEARDAASPDSGIIFGRGWYAVESHIPPEVFRWAGESAELLLEDPPGPGLDLVLDIEPGPSSGRPLQLEIEAAGQAPVCQSFDRRLRVRLRFASPYPKRLQLRTKDAGVRVCGDPRPLNFRVFHVEWERARGGGEANSLAKSFQVTLQPVSWTMQAAKLRQAFLHLMRKLAEGRSLVPLTVPVSPGLRRFLQFCVGSGGGPSVAAADPQRGAPDFLHTNACGDFTLLAREHWFDLRGYPEMDLFSMNLDSLFCFAAHYGGAVEEMLSDPMRIYHIEHGSGSGWTPEGQAKLFERIAAKGLSFLRNEEVLAMAAEMRRLKAPMIFNHEDWGLSAFTLKETVVGSNAS
jgi:hypothetical protein